MRHFVMCYMIFVTPLQQMLESLPSQHLPDICAALVKASFTEKIQVLDAVDLTDRFRKALPLLMRQIEVNIFIYCVIMIGFLLV